MLLRTLWICLFTSLISISSSWAENWPAWRGADRTDVSTETGLLREWPADGPALAWLSEKCGVGYAGFAVVDDNVYTMGAYKNDERLVCLDAATGETSAGQPCPRYPRVLNK